MAVSEGSRFAADKAQAGPKAIDRMELMGNERGPVQGYRIYWGWESCLKTLRRLSRS